MDGQIHEVERLLGNVSLKCNARAIDRKVGNMKRWNLDVEAKGTQICSRNDLKGGRSLPLVNSCRSR